MMQLKVFLVGLILPLLVCCTAATENAAAIDTNVLNENTDIEDGDRGLRPIAYQRPRRPRPPVTRYGYYGKGSRSSYYGSKGSKSSYYGSKGSKSSYKGRAYYGKGKGGGSSRGYYNSGKGKGGGGRNGKGKGDGGGGNTAMRLKSPYDIPTTAIQFEVFSTFVTALTATGLVAPLSSPKGPFTVFAPTDAAFAALPDGLVACLLNDLPTLQTILMYHIAKGQVLSSQLSTGQQIRTVQGEAVEITVYRTGQVFVNRDAEVISPDLTTRNGVIHVIDDVLVPPSIDVTQYLNTCSPE